MKYNWEPPLFAYNCQKLLIRPSFDNVRRCFTFNHRPVCLWLPKSHLNLRSQVSSCWIVFKFKKILFYLIFFVHICILYGKRWIDQKQDIVNEYCVLPCKIWWKIACSSPKHPQCSRQKTLCSQVHFMVDYKSPKSGTPQAILHLCLTLPAEPIPPASLLEWRNTAVLIRKLWAAIKHSKVKTVFLTFLPPPDSSKLNKTKPANKQKGLIWIYRRPSTRVTAWVDVSAVSAWVEVPAAADKGFIRCQRKAGSQNLLCQSLRE